MADTKITALTAITTVDPAVDVLPIVDVSDTTMAASGTTKKITSNQILGAGGTATLANATITGDLTVDTSTLKVDSANNRVGIVTASPADYLEVVGNGANGIRVSRSGLPTQYTTLSAGATGPSLDASSAIGALTFGIGGSTKMTVDSSGNVGIGVTPSAPLDVRGPFNGTHAIFTGTVNRGLVIATRSDGLADSRTVVFNAAYAVGALGQFAFQIAGTDKMLLDSEGNLILSSSNTPATLTTNGQLTVNATSNTNLRFSYRGSDGVTRTANLTLA